MGYRRLPREERDIENVRYLKEFLVNLLQSVDTFFELDVVLWKLGLKP